METETDRFENSETTGRTSRAAGLRRVGLEDWLRSKGLRTAPIYTLLQIGVVILGLAIAVFVVPLFR